MPQPPASSFEEFYAASERIIRRAVAAKHGARYADDATAEAMTIAVRDWESIGLMTNPIGYVYRIAVRAAGRAHRKDASRPSSLVEPTDELWIDTDLEKALLSLSGRQRAAVLLVHGWGYSYDDAASALGVKTATLRNHLERAMAKLRKQLREEHTDEA